MATVLVVSTHGSDDPTRATLPFLTALGTIEAGHEAQLSLAGEAVYLMKDEVAGSVRGVGWPPIGELMAKVVENKIPIFV